MLSYLITTVESFSLEFNLVSFTNPFTHSFAMFVQLMPMYFELTTIYIAAKEIIVADDQAELKSRCTN